MKLSTLASSYLRDQRARNLSPLTVRNTKRVLDAYIAHAGQELHNLTRHNIRAWIEDMQERGLAASTIESRLGAFQGFCSWLVAEGELAQSPMTRVSVPHPQPSPVPLLTDAQLDLIFRAAKHSKRDTAIFRTLLDTGVRVAELQGMTRPALDLDQGQIWVRGKGGRMRVGYFSAQTARALDRYLRHRKDTSDALWLGHRGPLQLSALDSLIRRYGERLGFRLHAHAFRHTWAHRFLSSGAGTERDLKRLAGWRSDAMLSRYGASGADERAKDAARRFHRGR